MTEQDNKLTPEHFSAPEPEGGGTPLTATTFEPLSEAVVTRAWVSPTQIALGAAAVVVAALLFFLFTARSVDCTGPMVTDCWCDPATTT